MPLVLLMELIIWTTPLVDYHGKLLEIRKTSSRNLVSAATTKEVSVYPSLLN